MGRVVHDHLPPEVHESALLSSQFSRVYRVAGWTTASWFDYLPIARTKRSPYVFLLGKVTTLLEPNTRVRNRIYELLLGSDSPDMLLML